MPTEVVIVGLPRLRRQLKAQVWLPPSQKMLSSAAHLMRDTARQLAMEHSDTGVGAQSFVAEISDGLATVYSPLEYMSVQEHGRSPGSRQPPVGALGGWAKRHGFVGSLFVLARSIGRRGTPARRTFERAISKVLQAIPRLEREASIEIESAWNKVP